MVRKNKKTIIIISRRVTPPFFIGGDSVTTFLWAKALTKKGIKVIWIGSLGGASDFWSLREIYKVNEKITTLQIKETGNKYMLDLKVKKEIFGFSYRDKILDIKWFLVRDSDEFNKYLKYVLIRYHPQAAITYLEGAPEAMDFCADFFIPVFNVVHDMESWQIPALLVADYHRNNVIFVSKACAKSFQPLLRYSKGIVIYPPFEIPKMNISQKDFRLKRYVTLINPSVEKGVTTFLKITESLPDVKFLIVKNWGNIERYQTELSNHSNIFVIPRQPNIGEIFKKTKILLMPSLWAEAFGRVIVEAALHEVPTIGSNRGGIPEAIGLNGGSVMKTGNTNIWANEIKRYLDDDLYQEMGKKAKESARRRFCSNNSLNRFSDYIISQLVK